jgi:hypothetical protein
MDAAVRLGLDLQMYRQDFAAKHGAQDAVLTECWRRTWWMLYMVDGFYAGTLGAMNFITMDVDATVDLPCEEVEYEQGVSFVLMPVSRYLAEMTKLHLPIENSGSQNAARF